MKANTWQVLEELFSGTPILKSQPVDTAEIAAAESVLGIPLSHDYKDFIARYGGAIVGPCRIFGLRKAAPMGTNEDSFVTVTKMFRRQGWPGVKELAVISMDHSGNPIGLDAAGRVWVSDHDARVVRVVAEDFETYLRKSCLNLKD